MGCPHCHDTEILTLKGIVQIFLRPKGIYILLAFLFAVAAVFSTPFLWAVSIILLLLPLAQADLRIYLFLPVFLAHLAGKKVNCPKCNPGGTLFRSPFAEMKGKDPFDE